MKFRFLYRGLKARFHDERAEIASLVKALGSAEIAVDVGANKGSYLPSLSRAVPEGLVVAFEPQPHLAEYLKLACASAGITNVIVEPVGVSEKKGILTLAIPGDADSSPGASFEQAVKERESCRTVDVPVYTLDEYFGQEQRRIGAIKIDAEGHELSVLRGAENILGKHHPLVVCECESRHMTHGSVETVLEYFHSLSYGGFFVHRSRLVPISEFKADIHQSEVGERFWDHKDYCNNFIMVWQG
ncbi:MAG: FkbM family methyltransferase [Desulfobulbales bacterium]|nr:FkbM family methyltransferase [Desulfobulbales bacterium]